MADTSGITTVAAGKSIMILGGIIVLIIIIAVAAALSSGNHSKTTSVPTTTIAGRSSVTSSPSSTVTGSSSVPSSSSTTAASTSASTTQSGSSGSGVLRYRAASASGNNYTKSLTEPLAEGFFFCLQATWNSSTSGSGVLGPEAFAYVSPPLCNAISGQGQTASAVAAVYNATNYTSVFGSFNANYTSYSVGAYPSELTVIPYACTGTGCALLLPSGCSTATQASYINASVQVAVCPSQSPGTYSVGVQNQQDSGPNVYVFYNTT